ncbi:MAG: polysaccharide biosynthesis tyrosine autokinase [Aureliella sp.]
MLAPPAAAATKAQVLIVTQEGQTASDLTPTVLDKKRLGKDKDNDGGEFSIDLLAVLARRWPLIVASGVFGLIVGATYFLFFPPKYESRSQILLMQDEAVSVASNTGVGDSSPSEDLLATHMSVIQSKRLVREALEGAELLQLPSIVENLGEDETPESFVIDNLYVTRGGEGAARDARILTVAMRHVNPEDSQILNRAIVDHYQEFVKKNFNKDTTGESFNLIEKARTDIQEDMDELAEDYKKFRQASPLLASTDGGANIHALRYEELAAELSTLQSEIDDSTGRLKLVKSGLAALADSDGPELQKLALIDERNAERLGILVTVERGEAQTASFQALQPERMAGAQVEYSSLLNLKAKLTQALSDYGPKHPEVVSLQTQVDEMAEFIAGREKVLGVNGDEVPLTPDDIMSAYVGLLENDLVALKQRKSDLEKQQAEAEAAAKELLELEFEDEQFRNDLLRQEELYASVIEQIKDFNLNREASPLIQEVVEEASIGEKVSPNAPIAAAISMLTAMLLAGSSVLVAELSDKTLHSSEDIEDVYGAQVLSSIPDFSKDAETRLAIRRIAKTRPSLDSTLITYHDSKSRISEVFRGIRTQLLFQLSVDKRLFMVTSPSQGEGKSTTGANLAISLAGTGKSVALVDCDLRRPRVDKMFSLSARPGVSDVLNSVAELENVLNDSPVDGLRVITAGTQVDNPAEILARPEFTNFLQELKSKFDVVMIDCPPLLPVADPAIIAANADGVLLVTAIGPDALPKAKRASSIIESTDAEVLGVIVNKTGNKGIGYGDDEYGYSAQYAAQI